MVSARGFRCVRVGTTSLGVRPMQRSLFFSWMCGGSKRVEQEHSRSRGTARRSGPRFWEETPVDVSESSQHNRNAASC
jgi:hypothetical protein